MLKEVFRMATEKYPPIFIGTSVRTTAPNMSMREEWTDEGWAERKWGMQGEVITHRNDSHGLCYDVQHKDGTVGCYDPSELEVIEGISLDELQSETEKLLSLLKDRQPGLFIWNRLL
jgi:hypothetical protein